MSQNNKSDSGVPSGAGDSAASKTDSTGSSKATAKKKQQPQKNQKSNPPAKKKSTQQAVKYIFEGIASGVNPMKGIVVADGNGNKAGQFRVFQKKLAGAAADDKAYGLDSAIIDLIAKKKSDFVKPKPDVSSHSRLTTVMEADGTTPTGEIKLICFDPIAKDQMEAEYNMDLKIQSSNWNQYNRMEEGYYRTAIGNVDNTVMTYCRMDKRMSVAERNKDLILFLRVLRSVCAQNHGAVKVDEEFKNLCTLHSAVGYKQQKTVTDADYADEVLDRYESAIFTCGKFIGGQSIYDKVLANYSIPMTFKEYLALSDTDQEPIDLIVKERMVARLIIKNSLNDNARAELVKTYSVNNNSCYPNTISEALSLLVTFKMKPVNNNNRTEDDAIVSYHETFNSNNDDVNINNDVDIANNNEQSDFTDSNDTNQSDEINESEDAHHVSFNATVMAAVIAEATANIDDDHFIGASFEQLQEVDDVYEDNEPDLVCCAHVVDLENDNGVDVPEFVMDANIKAQEHNEMVRTNTALITRHSDFIKDFELMIYHTAHRIMLKDSSTVGIFHYEPGRPELISHTYGRNIPESIVDYSDVLRFKFKQAGVHDTTTLMSILSNRTDIDAMKAIKLKFNAVGLKGINTSTVKILREENTRNRAHGQHNCQRYHRMNMEIGTDAMMMTFPVDHTLLHHVVSCVAVKQDRRKPNRWVNKITQKLIDSGVTNIEDLELKINDNTLNTCLDDHGLPRLHTITIAGFEQMINTPDFHQGRS
jgi:hypothetical protein